ncbi:MAG: dinitrogenase iron-molybdenum cofactor biosynthesis protein [Bacteroidales bacterium]|nr:dinitrogenase iron-molybdenum cofactor biosynthesis protein [Bacteroidales bacterium]
MRIAVPTRDGRVDDHFGHCDHYTVFTVEDNAIVETFDLPSPQGCGCKSGIAADLQQLGVEVMLAGNMGEGAKNKLAAHNIKAIRGCSGDVVALVNDYLAGKVDDSGYSCESHDCGDHGHEEVKIVGYSAAIKADNNNVN